MSLLDSLSVSFLNCKKVEMRVPTPQSFVDSVGKVVPRTSKEQNVLTIIFLTQYFKHQKGRISVNCCYFFLLSSVWSTLNLMAI